MSSTYNQRQRSKAGAKVLKSKKDVELGELRRIDKQLAKAANIEAQLGALTNKNTSGDDNKSYKLRSHLCEVLSDILISNPKISLERDCFQRLWRGCFYNPIRIWRQRVSREKRKRSPSLATTKEGFKHFLCEAVTLYNYLVLQYLTKLVPSNTQQDMTQQSRDTLSTAQDRSQLEDTQYASQSTEIDSLSSSKVVPADSLEGVVRGLYKLYIFLGDLHRYAEGYNKAESNYLNASKLGPGLGNPYNQLAVVAFSKDAYCVALYWYARSLLATHEKFSTSSNNLERLFSSNREFLLEHGRNSTPIIFINSMNKNSNNKSTNRNSANSNMLRAKKAAAIKSCLTYFVDLHYDLYEYQEKSKKEEYTNDDDPGAKKLREKMKHVIASLKSLVQVSGFSDSLLCKIVVINSFSLERTGGAASEDSINSTISECLAEEFIFSLGLILAEQVEKVLVKASEKVMSNKLAPSVRCLLPFEMLLDFVAMRLQQRRKNKKSHDSCHGDTIEFWKRVSVVGNLVREIFNRYKMDVTGNNGSIDLRALSSASTSRKPRHSTKLTQIKEYKLLKGYRPFCIVNDDYLSNEAGFLNEVEAIDVLELSLPQSSSQDTCSVSAISEDGIQSGGMQENKAKLLRVLEICNDLSLPTSFAPLVLENGNYRFQENNPVLTSETNLENENVNEDENSHRGGNFSDDSYDEADDIIIYQQKNIVANDESHLQSKTSGDTVPPLSVAKVEKSPQNTEAPNKDITMAIAEEKCSQPALISSIKPPPGFGESAAAAPSKMIASVLALDESPLTNQHLTSICYNPTTDLPVLPSPLKNRNILDQVIQGRIPSADSSSLSIQLLQQQDYSMIPIPGLSPKSNTMEMLYPPQYGRSNLTTSVEESIRIFGDMKTSNPFVVDPPPSAFLVPINKQISDKHQQQNDKQNASIFPNYDAERNLTSDDTKWLNSNLLNSLWMSESSETKNPWAGK